jgi:hypothetical protein
MGITVGYGTVGTKVNTRVAGWAASGDSGLFAEINEAGTFLKLKGVIVDDIFSKYNVARIERLSSHDKKSGQYSVLDLWRDQRDIGSTCHPLGEKMSDAFAMSLVCGQAFFPSDLPVLANIEAPVQTLIMNFKSGDPTFAL